MQGLGVVNFPLMNECLKVEEVGLIVSQTCEKKNYVGKKNLR